MAKDPARQSPSVPDDVAPIPADPSPNREQTILPSPHAGDATDLFFNTDPKPSDDTPTIISKLPPRSASSDEVWNGSLRGRRLAHFELIEPVGVGGMAAVIRARDLQLDRMVALKILPPEMAHDQESVQRFHHEARAAAKLDHENIARVYFCGEDQNLHFIAFEFVEGENLRSVIEKRGSLPVTEALHYMLQVATGLAHAASRGVIHRDIKPSNIIISPNGRAKLVDMGLARSIGPQIDGGLTQSGVTLGTFDYISPEQALEPRDADIRSDIYSLGCTFYHVVAGQPPVPEGTAARKLHHHQQVAPLDPRQLNPAIPDEVAAILGRMMAKDPAQRYQKAEHLVQHLLSAAQKMGAAPDLPDGVLYMDAPLPTPPRPRPLLWTVVAALMLVGLVVVLSQAPQPPWAPAAPSGIGVAATNQQSPKPASIPSPNNGAMPPVVPHAQGNNTVTTDKAPEVFDPNEPQVAALTDYLKDRKKAVVKLAGDLDLTAANSTGEPALVFQGDSLSIEPRPGVKRPTLRLESLAYGQKPRVGLLVKSGKVTLRNLCFEVNGKESPDLVLAALVREGGEVLVENCLFVQKLPPTGKGDQQLSSVRVQGLPPGDAGPAVRMVGCCFVLAHGERGSSPAPRLGQNAVTVTGGGLVQLHQCAFGPHAAVVALQGDDASRLSDARVEMTHCTALLAGESAVVRLDRTVRCTVEAMRCLFSRPDLVLEDTASSAVLVRQTQPTLEGPEGLTFLGENNRYHNLTAFWTSPAFRPPAKTFDEFRKLILLGAGRDEGSAPVADWPWDSQNPLQDLRAADDRALRQAFQVKVTLAALRSPIDPKHLIGVEHGVWGGDAYTGSLPPLESSPPVARGTRTVRPGKSDSAREIYPDLEQAIASAQSGDAILIESSDPVPVASQRLQRQTDLTLKGAPGYRPTLVLDADADFDENAFLFRVADAKLKLEGLDILLRPGKADVKSLAAVAAAGDGEVSFKDCVLTLDAGNAAVSLAVVSLVKGMRGDRPAERQLRVSFQNCVARGHGDFLAGTPGRPFDLQADNVLAALTGSFLRLSGAGDEGVTPVEVQLRRVTTYLGGHLLSLTADKETKSLPPVHVRPVDDCLFIAADSKVLVYLDGPDLSGDRMRELLTWEGSRNAYNKFMDMLDQMPSDKMGMRQPLNKDNWRQFAHDTGQYDKVKLSEKDLPGRDDLPRVSPSRFKPIRTDFDPPYGADVETLVKLLRDGR